MSLRRPTVLALALAVALLLAACGASSGADSQSEDAGGHMAAESTAEPVEGASEITVNAVDIDFRPASFEVVAGEPVNVTVANDGETLHDFTLEAADVHVNVEPGETKTTSFTINEPGRYKAECTVADHAEAGMTIGVVVGETS